jgi:chromosome segregation ATPase
MALNYWAYRESNLLNPFSFGCGCSVNHNTDDRQDKEIGDLNGKFGQVETAITATIDSVNNNTNKIADLGDKVQHNTNDIDSIKEKIDALAGEGKLSDTISELSKKVDGFPDKYYTKEESDGKYAPLESVKTINDVVNGIYDVIDDINQNVCTFGDLKDTVAKNSKGIIDLFSDKADKLALSEEIERAKGAEKVNTDALQEEVTRATTKENELKGSIDTLSATVDTKEKGLSDRIDALGNDVTSRFVDTEGKIQAQKENLDNEKLVRKEEDDKLKALIDTNAEDLRGVHTELTRLDNVKANKTDIEDSLRNLNRGIDDKNNELSTKISGNTVNIDVQRQQLNALKVVVDGKLDKNEFANYSGATEVTLNTLNRNKADLTALTEANDTIAALRNDVASKATKDNLDNTNARVDALENLSPTLLTKTEAANKYMPLLSGATRDEVTAVDNKVRVLNDKLAGKVDESQLDEKLSPLTSLLKDKWKSNIKAKELNVDDLVRDINKLDGDKANKEDVYSKPEVEAKLLQLKNDLKREYDAKLIEATEKITKLTKDIGYISELKNVETGIANYDNSGNGILDVLHKRMHEAFADYDFQNELVRLIHKMDERIKTLESR